MIGIGFEGGPAGYIDEELTKAGSHRYNFMPYRSFSHYALGQKLEREGQAEVEVITGNERGKAIVREMGIRHIVLQF